ncbi:MAG: MarR family transcriptional regulator [Myxococcaceae bacterium]
MSEALVRAAKFYLRQSAAGLTALGLQQGQDVLLRLLWKEDGVLQSELIGQLNVEPPTMTKMLARLEKAGFVKRKRDPKSARQWRVYLTAQGKKVEPLVHAHWSKMDSRATQGLSAEEQRLFVELAIRIRDNMRD